ncbi:hypothetical protein VHARVF571_250078 [Vibrio harveyi]|nr:hypothetical protein VHARVF571_250078 [Vibrio harveyi]
MHDLISMVFILFTRTKTSLTQPMFSKLAITIPIKNKAYSNVDFKKDH